METSEIVTTFWTAGGVMVFIGAAVAAVVFASTEDDFDGEDAMLLVWLGMFVGVILPLALAAAVVAGIVWLLARPFIIRARKQADATPKDGDYVVAVMDDGSVLDGIVGGSVTYLITPDGQAEFDPDRDVWRKIERQAVHR